MYKIIRASCGYETVVVAGPNNKCYVRKDDQEASKFKEITELEASMYFSGQADGMGFAELPEQDFESLEKVEQWTYKARVEFLKERLLMIWNDKNTLDQEKDNPYELMDLLMDADPLTKDDFKNRLKNHGLAEKWPEFQKRYEGKFKTTG